MDDGKAEKTFATTPMGYRKALWSAAHINMKATTTNIFEVLPDDWCETKEITKRIYGTSDYQILNDRVYKTLYRMSGKGIVDRMMSRNADGRMVTVWRKVA